MKYLNITVLVLLLSLHTRAQQIILIKDSILNAYMKSGFANKHFAPVGKSDKQDLRQGKWKDFEVAEEGSYQVKEGEPLKTIAHYLFYGEGTFTDNKRNGDWKIYVIEDKSFKKILSRKLFYDSDGKPSGPFTYYYPDGKIAQTGNYVEGNVAGESIMFYPDGAVFGKQLYTAGKKHGRQEYFYPDGEKLQFAIHYENGVREGLYEAYYKEGGKKEIFNNVADSIDGVYQYYYPSGQLWTEKIYKNGLLLNITASYDKDGKELDKGTLKDGNGYINYYTKEGKVYLVVTYENGIVIKEENR